MKFLELCSGIGGFRLGLQRNGFTCAGYAEIDRYASMLYKAYFNDDRNFGDVTKIDTNDLPEFKMLVGGFPCQAFSIAGKRKGFNDTRGTIFFEFERIARAKKPKILLFENVRGLLSHEEGRTFATILTSLAKLGYDLQWGVLNSKFYGLPQNRERLFIVGHLGKRGGGKILFKPQINCKSKELQRQQVVANTVTARYSNNSRGSYVVKREFPSQINGRIRRLTPLECFRLQGFPDDMHDIARNLKISDTQLYKMAGNAVSVNVIEWLGKQIKAEIIR
ncbi:MAG: DNA cytosine methyltransferase [Campylobacter sp.]|nr:DNA cytosine methyltransferase [Campylobacter sp.]